mmetsp:Transcript_65433/g.156088  ORF Transcript_65433/g.156088 Transcript_65433/m.156088 type:complete len:249 (+) Transcript_65433:4075-4821(+)
MTKYELTTRLEVSWKSKGGTRVYSFHHASVVLYVYILLATGASAAYSPGIDRGFVNSSAAIFGRMFNPRTSAGKATSRARRASAVRVGMYCLRNSLSTGGGRYSAAKHFAIESSMSLASHSSLHVSKTSVSSPHSNSTAWQMSIRTPSESRRDRGFGHTPPPRVMLHIVAINFSSMAPSPAPFRENAAVGVSTSDRKSRIGGTGPCHFSIWLTVAVEGTVKKQKHFSNMRFWRRRHSLGFVVLIALLV